MLMKEWKEQFDNSKNTKLEHKNKSNLETQKIAIHFQSYTAHIRSVQELKKEDYMKLTKIQIKARKKQNNHLKNQFYDNFKATLITS